MKPSERLKSPAALAVQGFAAGALMFFTVHPLAPPQAEVPTQTGQMELSVPA